MAPLESGQLDRLRALRDEIDAIDGYDGYGLEADEPGDGMLVMRADVLHAIDAALAKTGTEKS